MKKFNVGDFIFCAFALVQIKRMEGDQITEVTDGHLTTSSLTLNRRCFALDLRIKSISDSVAYMYDQLYQRGKHINLNFPDLNTEYVNRWIEICNSKDNREESNEKFTQLESFHKTLLSKIELAATEKVEGISIFRKV